MRFAIYEENLERLEKKVTAIGNKCKQHGYPFYYKVQEEEFRTYKKEDGEEVTLRYIWVDVTGVVKHSDWEFVAVVAHEPAGNVIRQMKTDIEVPKKYYTTEPVCEHCNTKRRRKDTYLVYNHSTDEWKQVGKSCLTEFTNGMDAELVASYIAMFDSLIEGYAPSTSARFERYERVEDILCYAFETVKHFGYLSASVCEYSNEKCTRERCLDYYRVRTGATAWMSKILIDRLKEEMDFVKFNPDSNKQIVADALAWALEQEDDNTYIHNLQTICKSEYCSGRNLGILISLAGSYNKHLGKLSEKERRESAHSAEVAASKHIGSIGDKLKDIEIASYECIHTRDTMYGLQFMYKFTDVDGNVFMWSTGNVVDSEFKIHLSGTVKEHQEFNGVKQTWLTRCKVNYISKLEEETSTQEQLDAIAAAHEATNKMLDEVFGN